MDAIAVFPPSWQSGREPPAAEDHPKGVPDPGPKIETNEVKPLQATRAFRLLGGCPLVSLVLLGAVPGAGAVDNDGDGYDDADDCQAEKSGGGWGGQKVECPAGSFYCESAETLAVTVRSGDEDAYVYGNVDCGGSNEHCDGQQFCQSTPSKPTSYRGSGRCWGGSDEIWRSYIYIKCTSAGVCVLPTCGSDAAGLVVGILFDAVGGVVGAICNPDCASVVPELYLDMDLGWIVGIVPDLTLPEIPEVSDPEMPGPIELPPPNPPTLELRDPEPFIAVDPEPVPTPGLLEVDPVLDYLRQLLYLQPAEPPVLAAV